ncbi:mannosyl-oligosaccharide alpha-1,2-mannosidase [Collariella sp. IMI 366227]|nr:mannosyl-oligosaccharide alpha-1,2-mannosidase [Collariella sp. IMI 366227]
MMLMKLTSPLAPSRIWLLHNLTYDQDQNVNTFKTTIRMLGSLLGAQYLSTLLPDASSPQEDSVYLTKAVDLADRLLAAYGSRSDILWSKAGTVQLEMKHLAHLTGDETYWRTAEKMMQVLDDNAMEAGLMPIHIDPPLGVFVMDEIEPGRHGDFYYAPQRLGRRLSPKMDHLVCFLPGAIAQGATGGNTLTEARTKSD